MNISFFSGPGKVPFTLNRTGMVENVSAMPFHGIMSRGMLNLFLENDLDASLWYKYAHLLDEQITTQNEEFDQLRLYKKKCGLLSYSQSALCAGKYLEQYCLKNAYTDPLIDLVNIKEGHTSSVWKVDIAAGNIKETFVLNVARDKEAGTELKESSEKLHTIGTFFPDLPVAKVQDIYALHLPELPAGVIITRNQWIPNALEIHCRKNQVSGSEELLIVDRFLTDPVNPSRITSILGRLCTPSETQSIRNFINEFITCATSCLPEEPHLNINDGDVVWDGEKAVVVALS